MATSWGGTRIEVWSSPDAIKKCPMDTDYGEELINVPTTPSVLWNSMMYPFTNMTIYGAIWYQGESNAGIGYISHHSYTVFGNTILILNNSIAEANLE